MSLRPRRRRYVEQFNDIPVVGNQRRLWVAAIIIGGVVIVALIALLVTTVFGNSDPDTALSLQLGGPPHSSAATPRNFRLWTVYPDGKLRFQSAYFPVTGANAPLSEVVTIAGPLVNKAEDIQKITYFGALNVSGVIQSGPGGDASRVFEMISMERDPAVASYGINVLTSSAPYLSVDSKDARYHAIAMGAPPQNYYVQMIWAIAIPPGSQIGGAAYADPTISAAQDVLRPYRRVTLDGWTIYYFDTSKLDKTYTIRVRYQPPAAGAAPADPDFWKADRSR